MKTTLQTSQILFINKSLETDFSKISLVSLIKKDTYSYVFHAYDPKNFRFLIVKILKKVLYIILVENSRLELWIRYLY